MFCLQTARKGLVMFFGAAWAMYLMKEVLPLCRAIHCSGG
ncbi:hypothetical protein CVCC1112_3091 [Paenarthrobacter nicotinovorans]|nr:hypothetical protein CVCC1112_3091 [Paenarthrobacter nicotinovorans]